MFLIRIRSLAPFTGSKICQQRKHHMPRSRSEYSICSCGRVRCKEATHCLVCWRSTQCVTFFDFVSRLSDAQRKLRWRNSSEFSIQHPLKYTCPKHGEGTTKYRTLVYLKGETPCKLCRSENKQEKYLEECLLKHHGKYTYPRGVGSKTSDKIEIVCPTHGVFYQSLKDHKSGVGCKYCHYNSLSELKKFTKAEFISKARQVHGDFYNYDQVVYRNSTKEVEIVCPLHGKFTQLAGNHLSGKGCLRCFKERMVSKLELDVKKYINTLGVKFDSNTKVAGYEVDIIFPEYNLGFEVNGTYWHCTDFRKKFDHQRKSLDVQARGISLGHIWEHDWINNRRSIEDRIKDSFGLLRPPKITEVVEWDSGSFVCLDRQELVGAYSKVGDTLVDCIVSPGVSKRRFIEYLLGLGKFSSIQVSLDEGELINFLNSLGFTAACSKDPEVFYVTKYPLKKARHSSNECFKVYDSGKLLLTKDK